MNFNNVLILLIIKVAFCDEFKTESYPKTLTLRKNQVFKSVPMYTLNNKGLQLKNVYDGRIICESEVEEATLMPIRCRSNCSYKRYTDVYHYTGVVGKEVTQSVINLGKKHCSRTKRHHNDNKFRKEYQDEQPGFYAYREMDHKVNQHSRRKRMDVSWNQLTIKLLVVIDNALFNKLDKDYAYIAEYMQIFWSAVDLKFRNITQPKINMNVASIIVVQEKNVLNYTDKYALLGQPNTINMGLALDNFKEIEKYFHNISLPSYDIIVTMTGSKGFLVENYKVMHCDGIAYREGVCDKEHNGIIIQDNGKYLGIKNGVHELAHTLGVRHDGYEVIEDSIDYSKCGIEFQKPGEHTIMMPIAIGSSDKFVWSSCSLEYFALLPHYTHVSCIAS